MKFHLLHLLKRVNMYQFIDEACFIDNRKYPTIIEEIVGFFIVKENDQ